MSRRDRAEFVACATFHPVKALAPSSVSRTVGIPIRKSREGKGHTSDRQSFRNRPHWAPLRRPATVAQPRRLCRVVHPDAWGR